MQPTPRGHPPAPSTGEGDGVLLRQQENWRRPHRAEGGSPQGAEVTIGDGWRCERRVSAEMLWGDVMRCAAGPSGSCVWSGQNRDWPKQCRSLVRPSGAHNPTQDSGCSVELIRMVWSVSLAWRLPSSARLWSSTLPIWEWQLWLLQNKCLAIFYLPRRRLPAFVSKASTCVSMHFFKTKIHKLD